MLFLYLGNDQYGPKFLASVFVAGMCSASFYGWLPLYLPELFRTNVRATGQGFGYNFGRVLAAIGTLQTKSREPELAFDDSDMGCDCDTQCKIDSPWKRQIATIKIDDTRDAITDNGQELYNLFAQRGIENVMICGVHLNMCVLGRCRLACND